MPMLKGLVMALSSAKCHVCDRPARAVRVWSKSGGVGRATEHMDGTPPCVEDDEATTVIMAPRPE